jgi:pimeloyl-ACP methyl ester carboxylesterase
MFKLKHTAFMKKRLFTIPAIGLIFCLLLASKLLQAQAFFTAEVKGKGKPMILIHGLYCNGDVWKETVERYGKDHECHILTLAGFGGNAPNLNDHFLESVKDDVIAYAKARNLKKPILMGHSMGGFIAFWAASGAPGVFEKVIAVDGLPFLPAIQMPGSTPESAKPMAIQIRNGMANQTAEQTLANQKIYLPTMISSQERVDQVAQVAMKADSKTQGQVMYELFTTDLRSKVSAIDCPVLLLGAWVAYKQYGVTRESALSGYQEQVASIRNAKVELSDTAKHFIFYDDPQWFFEKVDAFIK